MEEALVLFLCKEIERSNNNVFECSKKNRYDPHKYKNNYRKSGFNVFVNIKLNQSDHFKSEPLYKY